MIELSEDTLVSVRQLEARYVSATGDVVACDRVDLDIRRGEILGIAGESGSGKSTLLTALTRLERPPAVTSGGSILFADRQGAIADLVRMDHEALRRLRWREIAVVLQSAMTSLNPVLRLRAQFRDVLLEHETDLSKPAADKRAGELLEMVGIDADRLSGFPHELSGGMRQRAAIALALACGAQLLVCDEPTTAVDVVTQRQILSSLLDLRARLGFSVVFVTHDLSLLLEIADRIAVMYAGRIVEVSTPEELYRRPLHPYTRGLRDSFPPLSEPVRRMQGIPGSPPDLRRLPTGCAFHPRCSEAFTPCTVTTPALEAHAGRQVACHLHSAAAQEEVVRS